MKKSRSILFASIVALGLCAHYGYAAEYDPVELDTIKQTLAEKGVAPVMVNLFGSTWDDLKADLSGVRSQALQKKTVLLNELEGDYLKAVTWESGLGQLELYVNPAGLEKLINTENALAFAPGSSWEAKSYLSNADGSLSALEQEILRNGRANVEVVLNVDGLEYELQHSGEFSVALNDRQRSSVQNMITDLARSTGIPIASADRPLSAIQTLSVDYPAFLALIRAHQVRHVRSLAQQKRALAPQIDEAITQAFDTAIAGREASDTRVRVLMSVNNPLTAGFLSEASVNANTRINRETIDAIAHATGSEVAAYYPEIGVAALEINYLQYQRLSTLGDARLQSLTQVKPVAEPSLNVSANTIHLPIAWNSGFTGKWQQVAIADSGMRATHEMFRGDTGRPRMGMESCFGTDASGFRSLCPQKNAAGDSPPGLIGSGSSCVAGTAACSHGTHVAGIAAGRRSSNGAYQGMAPDAEYVSIQVFSENPLTGQLGAFNEDLAAAFALAIAETNGFSDYPLSINMSLGSGTYGASCPGTYGSTAIDNAILTLKSRNVPVIAATGNNGSWNGVARPACLPHVIKVPALNNDGTLNNVNPQSQLGNPGSYIGPTYLAPGFSVSSASYSSNTGYVGMGGTSMATPHVTGLMALAKSAMPGSNLDQIYAWIDANFTQNVYVPVGTSTRVYKALVLR